MIYNKSYIYLLPFCNNFKRIIYHRNFNNLGSTKYYLHFLEMSVLLLLLLFLYDHTKCTCTLCRSDKGCILKSTNNIY